MFVHLQDDADCSINANKNVEDNLENVPLPNEEASSGINFESNAEPLKLTLKKPLKKSAMGKVSLINFS